MIALDQVTFPTVNVRETRPSEKTQLCLDQGGQGGGVVRVCMFVSLRECVFWGAVLQKKGGWPASEWSVDGQTKT